MPPHIPLTIDGGSIRGRGSSDDLGPLAAQIIAAEELRKEKAVQEGDIGLLFVVGEENGGLGLRRVVEFVVCEDCVEVVGLRIRSRRYRHFDLCFDDFL